MEAGERQMMFRLAGSKRHGAAVKTLLRGLIGVALLGLIVSFVDIHDMAQAFLNARSEYIAVATLLMLINITIQILKWRYFVRLIDPATTNFEAAASLLFGIAVGSVTPGQIGEFGGRALHHKSVSAASIAGLTLVDKVQTMCIMGIGGVVSLVTIFPLNMLLRIGVSAASTLAFIAIFFGIGRSPEFIARFRFSFLRHRPIQKFLSAVSILHARDLIVSFYFSSVYYAVLCLQLYCLLNAFVPIDLWTTFLGFAALMFLKALLPISLADLGVREAGAIYFYGLLGIPNAAALNASLLLFGMNILLPSLVGSMLLPAAKPHE
jgi:uncharacterized protein (TIRG00374 family)